MRIWIGIFLVTILSIYEVRAEGLEIQAGGQKLQLPYWEGQAKRHSGGLLIVAGGLSGESLTVLLRMGKRLSKLGWSVALLNTEQLQDQKDWTSQLPEALSALRQKNNTNLVLLHYGARLRPLLDYFAKLQQVNGLILVSAFDLQNPKESPVLLEKIKFPVFDLVGQFDYDPVLDQAAARRKINHNTKYTQIKFPGAAHDYAYTRKMLSAYVHGWMKHLVSKKSTITTPPGPSKAPS